MSDTHTHTHTWLEAPSLLAGAAASARGTVGDARIAGPRRRVCEGAVGAV